MKEQENISMKEMLTKRSFEPITNCNCKIESRTDYAVRNGNKEGAFADLLNKEIEELQKARAIEEMAKDLNQVETDVGHILLNETFSYVKEHKKYNSKKDFSNAHTKTFEERTAEEMFKKGYRKLPEDSVVLSREEYEKKLDESYSTGYYFGKKETAEKFLNMLYWKAVKHIKGKNKNECFIEISFEKLDEIAEQFGVEIKE